MRYRHAFSIVVSVVLVMTGWLVTAQTVLAAEPIATGETNWDGVTVKVVSVIRKGSVLTVKFAAVNEGAAPTNVWFGFTGDDVCYIVDEESGTKYYVLTDKEGHPLAPANDYIDPSKRGIQRDIQPGKSLRVWMKFPAPPADVKVISLFLNETEPIEDVPITDR